MKSKTTTAADVVIDPPAPAEETIPAPVAPAQDPTAGVTAGTQTPEQKFTQVDLDRVAAERAKHAKSAERAALLKELGVEDVNAAKAAIQAAEDARKAQMTEAERLQAERVVLEKRAQDAEAARTRAEQERTAAQLKAAVVSRAAGRFANPEAIVKLADLAQVKQGDDGQFTGVEEALNALAEKEPWTLAPKGAAVPPSIGTTNPKTPKTSANSEEEMRARFFGGGKGRAVFEPQPEGVITTK